MPQHLIHVQVVPGSIIHRHKGRLHRLTLPVVMGDVGQLIRIQFAQRVLLAPDCPQPRQQPAPLHDIYCIISHRQQHHRCQHYPHRIRHGASFA